jgi:N-sulfoglucosamine sulfohydrolase
MGHIPEQELINTFWPDKIQPLTANPVLKVENGELQITCQTEGASIGYKRLQDLEEGLGWQIYTAPIDIDQEEPILVIAHRIGFAPSDTLQWN